MGLDINVAALGDWVPEFTRVNNRMAGITREPTAAEISAHRGLLAINALRVENLELFVHHIAPGAGARSSERTLRRSSPRRAYGRPRPTGCIASIACSVPLRMRTAAAAVPSGCGR
jgi:hypothetical protein